LNRGEFIDYLKQHIHPDSGLRQPSAEDVKQWTELGFFKYAPEYYREDVQTAIHLLQLERKTLGRRVLPEYGVRHSPTLSGLTQVISCVGASPTEERLIIERLKETGHISFAGWIGVNCHPISWQPLEKPGGDLMLITAEVDPGFFPPKGVLTPWGHRLLFDKTDKSNKMITLVSSPGEKAFHVMPPVRLSLPLQKGSAEASSPRGEKKEYTAIPIVVPAVKVEGVGLALVHLSYVTQDNHRIPAFLDGGKFPHRLCTEFLNVDSSSPSAITTFLVKYGISLHFERKEDSLTDVFLSVKEEIRQTVEMSQRNELDTSRLEQLTSPREAAFVDAELISQLACSNEYADFAWQCWQWSHKSQGSRQSLAPVTRFYSWEDYLRWEMLQDLSTERLPRTCKSCGALLPTTGTEQGRPAEYCEQCRNPSYRAKNRERARRYRKRKNITS